jgi:hypothetical protein
MLQAKPHRGEATDMAGRARRFWVICVILSVVIAAGAY